MRIAITYNLRATSDVAETTFTSAETVDFLATSISKAGHESIPVEVSGPVGQILERLERCDADLIFNVAEGWADSGHQSFYTSLFARLGIPFTGSGPQVQAVLRDKHLTKLVARECGIRTPAWRFLTEVDEPDLSALNLPVIVKPNAEGTSRGITQESVVNTPHEALSRAKELLAEFPDGVLIEEYIVGRELTVPYLAAVDNEYGGVLHPTEIVLADIPASGRVHNILDYGFKNYQHLSLHTPAPQVTFQTPADIPDAVSHEVRTATGAAVRALRCEDLARVDFRQGEDGRLYLLEVNALPGLEPGLSIHRAARLSGLDPDGGVVHAVLASAIRRYGFIDC